MYTIYGLIDPRYDTVRYVGMTRHTPEDRLRGHVLDLKKHPHIRKSCWLRELMNSGYFAEPFVLEYTTPDGWQEAERRWIAYFGGALVNTTIGGDGRVGAAHRPETKAKISASLRGRPVSPETRKLLSKRAVARGGPSLEQRIRIAETLRGRSRDPLSIAKQRESFKANEAAVKRIKGLTQAVPRELLLERAAKAEATRTARGTGLATAPRVPCSDCGRELRKIDFPRHRCERKP